MMTMTTSLGWTDMALRLALTVLAGILLGYNRSEHGKAAGMRTTVEEAVTSPVRSNPAPPAPLGKSRCAASQSENRQFECGIRKMAVIAWYPVRCIGDGSYRIFIYAVEAFGVVCVNRGCASPACYCRPALRENRGFLRPKRGIHLFFSCTIRRCFGSYGRSMPVGGGPFGRDRPVA
jgi:hypothetical protein